MTVEAAAALAAADRASLIAPAGCGKTWTLAHAAAQSQHPQLILTHTHAGVHALRRHLRQVGVPSDAYHLDTIAGYAIRWAAAYPGIAGWEPDEAVPDWDKLYPAATQVLERPQIKASIARSFRGLLVDEYQDCSVDQHGMVLCLAEVLPTRVVGDPLQGIFAFGGPLVDFHQQVLPVFPLLATLNTPWRWRDTNPALGAALERLRAELEAGQQPDLTTYQAVEIRSSQHGAVIQACADVAARGGTAVVIRAHAPQAHALASRLGGTFVSMEEAEGTGVVQAATAVQGAQGPARASVLLSVLEGCTTTVVPALRRFQEVYDSGEVPVVPRGKAAPAVTALNALAESATLAPLPDAIHSIRSYPDTVVYRPEIPDGLAAAATVHLRGEEPSLADAAKVVRHRQRREGRQLPPRVVSRTLLVKGLEFDHAVVFDTGQLDQRNLYVALTRAAASLTVIGS